MTLSTEAAVREHIRAFLAREMDAVIDGYAPDGVIIMSPQPVVGREAIAALFANMPQGSAPPDVVIDDLVVHGEFALTIYHDAERKGADSFVVRDGKIVMQSVYLGGTEGAGG